MNKINPLHIQKALKNLPKTYFLSKFMRLNSENDRVIEGKEEENPPYFMEEFSYDINYFIERGFYISLEEKLRQGIYDENYLKIDYKTLRYFLFRYGQGFNDGYYQLESYIDNENDPQQRTRRIIYECFRQRTYSYYRQSEDRTITWLYENGIYSFGLQQGAIYKAWELIIDKPKYFEPFDSGEKVADLVNHIEVYGAKEINPPKSNPYFDTYDKTIFRGSAEAQWFNYMLSERVFNLLTEEGKAEKTKDDKTVRGFNARINAIFENEAVKKIILTDRITLDKYATFLNSEYEANIKSKTKFSDPTMYEDIVENEIKKFQERLKKP